MKISQQAAVLRLEQLRLFKAGSHDKWLNLVHNSGNPDWKDKGGGAGGPPPQEKIKLARYGFHFAEAFSQPLKEGRIDEINLYRATGLKPKFQRAYFDYVLQLATPSSARWSLMTSEPSKCSCAIDCAGLHMIGIVLRTSPSNSLKSLFIERLENGDIAVPAVVWQEYEELFDEEAELIAPHVKKKISLHKKYSIAAAAIADKTNSQFSRGSYDRQTDIYVASICMVEKYMLLTTPEQALCFKKWDCCEVADLPAWAKSQGA